MRSLAGIIAFTALLTCTSHATLISGSFNFYGTESISGSIGDPPFATTYDVTAGLTGSGSFMVKKDASDQFVSGSLTLSDISLHATGSVDPFGPIPPGPIVFDETFDPFSPAFVEDIPVGNAEFDPVTWEVTKLTFLASPFDAFFFNFDGNGGGNGGIDYTISLPVIGDLPPIRYDDLVVENATQQVTGHTVPDSSSTLALLGMTLVGLAKGRKLVRMN